MDTVRPMWREEARCREMDPTIFYAQSVVPARKVCKQCPVAQECLTYALKTREPHGIWGGLGPGSRRMILQNMTADARKKFLEPLARARN